MDFNFNSPLNWSVWIWIIILWIEEKWVGKKSQSETTQRVQFENILTLGKRSGEKKQLGRNCDFTLTSIRSCRNAPYRLPSVCLGLSLFYQLHRPQSSRVQSKQLSLYTAATASPRSFSRGHQWSCVSVPRLHIAFPSPPSRDALSPSRIAPLFDLRGLFSTFRTSSHFFRGKVVLSSRWCLLLVLDVSLLLSPSAPRVTGFLPIFKSQRPKSPTVEWVFLFDCIHCWIVAVWLSSGA